jgi:hypothetical protein
MLSRPGDTVENGSNMKLLIPCDIRTGANNISDEALAKFA